MTRRIPGLGLGLSLMLSAQLAAAMPLREALSSAHDSVMAWLES